MINYHHLNFNIFNDFNIWNDFILFKAQNQIIIDIIYLSVLKADGNNYFLLETYHI